MTRPPQASVYTPTRGLTNLMAGRGSRPTLQRETTYGHGCSLLQDMMLGSNQSRRA